MFYDGWRDLMDNKSDPRTRDYPLMSSPFPTIAISLTYAYIVKVSGSGSGNHQSIIIGVGIELKMDGTEQNRTQQNIIPMGAIYADFVDHNWQILIWRLCGSFSQTSFALLHCKMTVKPQLGFRAIRRSSRRAGVERWPKHRPRLCKIEQKINSKNDFYLGFPLCIGSHS